MLFQLRVILRTLILPPADVLLLGFAGLVLLRRRRRLGALLVGIALAALWSLSTPVIADGLERAAEHYPALDLARPLDAQAIVMLGGGGYRSYAPEYAGPAPDDSLLEELTYGAWVARHTRLPVLVTGNGMEAITMKVSLARDFNIQTRWIDTRALDTYDNAQDSARILRAAGIRRIILVTSAAHMLRSVREFQAAGMTVVAAPGGIAASREHGVTRYLPSAYGLRRSYSALYAILGEWVRVVLVDLHLRRVVR